MMQPFWKTVWQFLKMLNLELPYETAIPLYVKWDENTCPQRYMYTNVYSSIIHNSPKGEIRASLVVQWLRICLPMQGTRVRALVQEDATCRGATKPLRHNY